MLTIINDDLKEIELRKSDYDAMKKRWPSTTEKIPQHYDLLGSYFRLRPVPDKIYTIKMTYYQKAALLTTNIENLWLQHASDLLIARAGIKIAGMYIRNQEALAMMMAEEQKAVRRLLVANQAREDANRNYTAED